MGDVIREMKEKKKEEKGSLYENDYEEVKALIDMVIGYFQFKSDSSEVGQLGIKHMYKLRWIIKKNMKNFQ